jgi:hypothetical protein
MFPTSVTIKYVVYIWDDIGSPKAGINEEGSSDM